MLFDIDDVELDVKGVWHIGAHHGQEYKNKFKISGLPV